MKRLPVLFLIIGFLSSHVMAQTEKITILNTRFDELNPVFAPDGKTLYFVRVNHPQNKFGREDSEDVWMSTRVGDGWTTPQRVEALNIGQFNSVLGVANEGNTVLLSGVYKSSGTEWAHGGLSFSNFENGVWGKPKELKVKGYKWKASKLTACMTSDANIIILGMNQNDDDLNGDLYLLEKDEKGNWKKPSPLTDLNTEQYSEFAPTLSPDGNTLYYSTNQFKKNTIKIVATKKKGSWSKWEKPVQLGDSINQGTWQSYLAIHPTNKAAYFCSRDKSRGGADMYSRNFLAVRYITKIGKIVDEYGVLVPRDKYILLANGTPIDSLVFGADGSYVATLPAGKDYVITPQYVNNKWGFNKKEATNEDKIVVTGKFLNSSNQPYPAGSFKFLANDLPVDEYTYSKEGLFTMKLPRLPKEGKYKIAARFDDKTIPLQYVTSDGKKETIKRPWRINGQLVNKDTKDKLATTYNVVVLDNATIKPMYSDNAFQMTLADGGLYNIQITAPGYLPHFLKINTKTNAPLDNILALPSIEMIPIKSGEVLELDQVEFLYGKSTIQQSAQDQLNEVATFFTTIATLRGEIACHMDKEPSANEESLVGLTQRRAEEIVKYLLSKGVKPEQLTAKGYGSSKPIADNSTREGRIKNRRVELILK